MSISVNNVQDMGNYNISKPVEKQKNRPVVQEANTNYQNQKNLEQPYHTINNKEGEKEKITAEDLEKSAKELSEAVQSMGAQLNFNIHEKTGRLTVKMVDSDGNILKEFPPEDFLDMVARIKDYIGSLIDTKV